MLDGFANCVCRRLFLAQVVVLVDKGLTTVALCWLMTWQRDTALMTWRAC